MTIELMKKWAAEVLLPNYRPGDILLMDCLAAHKNKEVVEQITSYGFQVQFFPPQTASELSPLDNFTIKLFKNNFRKLDRSSAALKKQAAVDAWGAIPAHSILSCWRKCKLIASPTARVEHEDEDEYLSEASEEDNPLSD